MKKISAICILLTLTFCSPKEEKVEAVKTDVTAGEYTLDKSHASLIFRVNHMGFSNYTAMFRRFDAKLQFDPQHPEKSHVVATIDPTSIDTNYPDPQKLDFNAELQNEKWLDAKKFTEIKFESKKVELTGVNSAKITGELDLHGMKHEVVLNATFNGGYAKNPMDPMGSRIGFSAHGSLKRSDFGIIFGIPQAGSKMGVSDEVEFVIEAEFNKPEAK